MIKKLRRSFVAAVMLSAFALLCVVLSGINLINVINIEYTTTNLLDYIIACGGVLPETEAEYSALDYVNPLSDTYIYEAVYYKNKFFAVSYSEDGTVDILNLENVGRLDKSSALKYADDVALGTKQSGYTQDFWKFKVVKLTAETRIYFVDVKREIAFVGSMAAVSVAIAAISLVLLFVVVLCVSKYALRPVIETSRQQKRFINDAGHELKTPLAIISANADVLELTCGSNEWIDSIHRQTKRMNLLVEHLLLLDKMDGKFSEKDFKEFYLDEAVRLTVESFAVLAQRENKHFSTDIEQNIVFNGNRRVVDELISVLVDNAVKYSPEGEKIKVSLFTTEKSLVLETRNMLLPGIVPDTKKIFDRFYRADRSRSRETGGDGIGLSVAKAAVEMHKGTITAKVEENEIIFTVKFNDK